MRVDQLIIMRHQQDIVSVLKDQYILELKKQIRDVKPETDTLDVPKAGDDPK